MRPRIVFFLHEYVAHADILLCQGNVFDYTMCVCANNRPLLTQQNPDNETP